jgi:transposase
MECPEPDRHLHQQFGASPVCGMDGGFRARRWVVERAHSWMNRFRGVLIRWAKRVDAYLAMLHFACALITWKKVLSMLN